MTTPDAPGAVEAPGALDDGTGSDVVRGAVIRFALWSAVTLVALSVGIVVVGHRVASAEALTEARERTDRLANLVVAPLVDRAVRAQRPDALMPLESLMETRLDEGTLKHVKLWAEDGTIIWSDETDAVGKTFELQEDVSSLFGTSTVTAEVSQLEKPENVYEQDEGELLEVYAGTRDRDGEPMVFEAYLTTDRISQDERAIIAGTLPIAIGALLLLQLAILPMAVSLARRVHRSDAARSRMTTHALRAAELEQRRIARELHDGVVQDLAGVGFTLPGIKRQLADTPEGRQAADTLEQLRTIVQKDVAALRTMMIDVYPPDLASTGLLPALEDLVSRGQAQGTTVSLDASGDLDAPLDAMRLAYRVVREGLHNVYKHSGAEHAWIGVHGRSDSLDLSIVDDGRGLSGVGTVKKGHLGLRLLEEAVVDAGGTLALNAPGPGRRGARLDASIPLRTV